MAVFVTYATKAFRLVIREILPLARAALCSPSLPPVSPWSEHPTYTSPCFPCKSNRAIPCSLRKCFASFTPPSPAAGARGASPSKGPSFAPNAAHAWAPIRSPCPAPGNLLQYPPRRLDLPDPMSILCNSCIKASSPPPLVPLIAGRGTLARIGGAAL